MSKPEHTDSPAAKQDRAKPVSAEPEPSVEAAVPPAGAPADAAAEAPAEGPVAKPGVPKPRAAAVGSAAAKPDLSKPKAAAAEPAEAERPAAADREDAKPAAAAARPASAEPEDAKPAAAPKADLSKPKAAAAESAEAERPAAAEPEDAEPAAAKADLSKPGAAAAGARPAEAKDGAEAIRTTSGNPVIDKADAVAAAVKAAAAKAAAAAGAEGRLLAGRYRLGQVLGKGGMGTVWRAEDETLGRTVAVKELRFGNGVDEDEKRRLITRTLREAKAIARIRSGGAVTVFDVVDEDGRPWIVMELIEGPSLAEFIREQGPLTPRRAAEVGLAVLDVLRAAHNQGILHRDVKPSNVLIASSGRVVLTDFGIAQVEGDPSITSTGMLVGAPSYISPERARGQKPGPPADMWSLGGLLYAAVEGVPPYDKGSALATLTAVMTEPVDPPRNAGPLTEIIYGLLVKDPALRLDEERARAMLTAVVNAPDPEPAAPVLAAEVEETRQISLSAAKEAAAKAVADKAAEKAEKKERERREREQRERARAALKAARKAAATAGAATAANASTAAAAPAGSSPSGRTAPVAAPLTDVMSRRTIGLAIAGVVVALAAIGSLLVYAFGGGPGGKKDQGKTGQGTTSSGNPTPGPSGKTGENAATAGKTGGASTDPSQGQTPNGQQSQGQAQGQDGGQASSGGQGQGNAPGGPAAGLPAGYAVVTDLGFHFSMAMPQGFRQTDTAGENSGAIYSRDGGFPRIQVDFTDKPGDDARKAWALLAPAVASSSQGYKPIRIDAVSYRDYPTVADWEFERDQKGIRVRVLNRGFKVDAKRGYAIMISCPADQWDGPECTTMRNVAFQTFQPLA
ncbi:serine/threonine-protein kinase [Streptomyces sp. BR123]|uniref:serine/threonine-protein kinase n=1 Tax=Streptomyces sp. BR123 TaxID=2749828 RepID=UPI00211B2FC6|nr:serine/threonine-protein kinase [Streptomyces sp. BR123]